MSIRPQYKSWGFFIYKIICKIGGDILINKVQPYEKLVDYIKNNPQKGLTIPHADIEQILGVPYRKGCHCLNSKYSYQVKKANDKLLTLGLALDPIQGYGYRILKDSQYKDVMRRKFNTAVKYMFKAKEYGVNTNVAALSATEYKEWEDIFNKVSNACTYLSLIPSPSVVATKKNVP